MKTKDVVDGVKRILESATAKLNALCEVAGIPPDDPVLTENPDEETDEGKDELEGAKENDSVEVGSSDDENVMPTPEDGTEEVASSETVATATEVPTEAAQVPVGDVNAGVAPSVESDSAAVEGGAAPLTPEDEEKLKQQLAAAGVQQ